MFFVRPGVKVFFLHFGIKNRTKSQSWKRAKVSELNKQPTNQKIGKGKKTKQDVKPELKIERKGKTSQPAYKNMSE